MQKELAALKEDCSEELLKVADQARLNFPHIEEGQRYLESYWESRLLVYQKSEEFWGTVPKIAAIFLQYDFQSCQEQFVAQGYPPPGIFIIFLS
ncbi:UNVERIFIED_CONTAM: hypothetical protein Slati_1351600 [Sesamum latifolium]|uniref:Uncharacterized protein n=1 Tax=Sesamum latifolium TaxID=2727402 RepID=A0AAW2XPJ8_9LAMI